jgi:2-dehydro-3-deoxyphosphogluconate aldolase/(4S)-4-hydroxy-2-oxoglutarate aldolase
VSCAGGSWLASEDAMINGEWDKITELAKQAVAGAK